jgi:ABC-type multidrug transport system fused ATPase/permease subunit
VGPSGSGKSTVTALLERFYDPTSGSITLDGTDLRLLNVRWLRDQIGLVMQEPKLFGKSIRENIAMGAPGITQEEIEQAARSAQAHDFVMSFPKGYDTQGAREKVSSFVCLLSVYCLNRCCFVHSSWRLGRHAFRYVKWWRVFAAFVLSVRVLTVNCRCVCTGGQRQRIAIARVLARKPALLILDEATSALDSESEAAVQQALDGVMSQRNATTIVIAHRLSTIKGADVIAVVKDGQIVETGNHAELLAKKGVYASLVEAQQVKSAQEEDTESKSETGSQHGSRHGAPSGIVDAEKTEDLKFDVDSETVFEFKNVHHRYPSRRDVDVFRGLNLTVRKGETLALGKSDVAKHIFLLLTSISRAFYDS